MSEQTYSSPISTDCLGWEKYITIFFTKYLDIDITTTFSGWPVLPLQDIYTMIMVINVR